MGNRVLSVLDFFFLLVLFFVVVVVFFFVVETEEQEEEEDRELPLSSSLLPLVGVFTLPLGWLCATDKGASVSPMPEPVMSRSPYETNGTSRIRQVLSNQCYRLHRTLAELTEQLFLIFPPCDLAVVENTPVPVEWGAVKLTVPVTLVALFDLALANEFQPEAPSRTPKGLPLLPLLPNPAPSLKPVANSVYNNPVVFTVASVEGMVKVDPPDATAFPEKRGVDSLGLFFPPKYPPCPLGY
jgi:hypothetical protein